MDSFPSVPPLFSLNCPFPHTIFTVSITALIVPVPLGQPWSKNAHINSSEGEKRKEKQVPTTRCIYIPTKSSMLNKTKERKSHFFVQRPIPTVIAKLGKIQKENPSYCWESEIENRQKGDVEVVQGSKDPAQYKRTWRKRVVENRPQDQRKKTPWYEENELNGQDKTEALNLSGPVSKVCHFWSRQDWPSEQRKSSIHVLTQDYKA